MVVGDRGLYSLYVVRRDLRVYYLICVPLSSSFSTRSTTNNQLCAIDDMSEYARGYQYGGVARSSDEYTLLILRISNTDDVGGGGWHRAWLPINAISNMKNKFGFILYKEDSSVIGDLTAGAN